MHVCYDHAHATQPETISTLPTFLPSFHQDGGLKPNPAEWISNVRIAVYTEGKRR